MLISDHPTVARIRRGNESRSRTHGKDALSGGNGGCSKGCRSIGGWSRARVGAVGRGRRILSHSGSESMSSACLHHGWVGEGEEMERRGGGEISKVIWNERGGGGRERGLNRWLRAAEELIPFNIHKYKWLVVVAQKKSGKINGAQETKGCREVKG